MSFAVSHLARGRVTIEGLRACLEALGKGDPLAWGVLLGTLLVIYLAYEHRWWRERRAAQAAS